MQQDRRSTLDVIYENWAGYNKRLQVLGPHEVGVADDDQGRRLDRPDTRSI